MLAVAVKVPTAEGGHIKYKTKDGVFEAVSPITQERFQSALVAQCHQGTFFQDVGHLGDGPAAQQILDGTYEYPLDLDQATRQLFEEAAATYAAFSPSKIAIFINPEDFTHFWQMACEHSGTSYSGLHYDHYIAASYCLELSLLHAVKLSICARNGVPLARWGKGLTVLLENILGNVFIHKLGAICLLEADFNWWNKLIFAKRMMQQAAQDGRIPQECLQKNTAIATMLFSPNNFSVIAPGLYIIRPD
jgi:hypothetical protein